jgi:hypothetical protein
MASSSQCTHRESSVQQEQDWGRVGGLLDINIGSLANISAEKFSVSEKGESQLEIAGKFADLRLWRSLTVR